MHSFLPIILSALAAGAAAQVTLEPTTICRGPTCTTCPVTETKTRTTTATATETETFVSVKTTSVTVVKTDTITKTDTVTKTTTKECEPPANCPTVTSTGTVCRSCFVPGCTTTAVLEKPAACGNLATQSVSFPCDRANVCNEIGCRTVYAIKTV